VEIKINTRNDTNIPGIFAAGDVTDVPEKQIIIAAGEGSKSALSVFHYLTQH
jgi:alkyl hydroperoxide reductase subunit F